MRSSGERCCVSILALASIVVVMPAWGADITVTNQSEFDAAIATATQSGHADTINADAVDISSGPALMLPAAATSIVINFNGMVAGPTVYNPVFDVGYGTTGGGLTIASGTTLNFNTANGIASLRVGMSDGTNAGTGTVNMSGGTINGLPTGPANYFTLNVGRGSLDSSGIFNQSGGSVFMNGGALQIGVAQATGVYNMSGNALVNMGAGTVYLGEGTGGNGTLYVHDSAQFLLNDGSPAPGNGQVYVGTDGGTGTIIQDGAGSRVVLNAQNGSHFGSGGGTGEYDISAGQLVFGGLASGSAGLTLGDDATGTGIVNQTGGVVTLNTGQIHFGAGTGIYNLAGGTFQVNVANPFSVNGSGVHEFNLAGGTIQALTNFSTSLDFNLSNVSTINTFDGTTGHTVTLSGPLSGAGGLIKAGDGILIFNAANTYAGGTEIAGGTLQLGASGSLASTGALQVDTGATFDINSHTQTVGSLSGAGTIDATTGALVAGGNNANTAFSGMMNGTFAKTGTGTLVVDGATFSSDSYIFQGAMAQTSGTTSFNMLAIGEGAGGTGSLNISGGALTLGNALQVGDFGGQGVVNQTGGTVQVASSLNIGNQGGTGTYNISGGELGLTALLNSVGRSTGTDAGTGTLNISGGLVDVGNGTDPSRLILGYSSGSASSQGTINQTGGTLRINNGSTLNLVGQGTATGIYNLNGGALEIGGSSLQTNYMNTSPSYQFNLGGGTIRVIGTALDTDVNAALTGGLSTIDTNGLGATFNGVLSGGGALEKAGAGTLIFNAANTYTGGTEVAAGTLRLGTNGGLASTTAMQVDAPGTFDLNGHTLTVSDLSGAGAILLGAGELTAGTANSTQFSGSISGSGGFVKQGSGALDLSGASTYTGDTIINGGRLAVNGSLVSDVFVNSGILGGNGSVGNVTVANGATIAPGNSIGTLSTTGITFAPSSIYQVELNPAGQSDKILASGAATINGGTVQLVPQSGNYIPGASYTILSASGGITGAFTDVTGTNFAFLDPMLSYDATNAFLTFERNGTTFASLASTPNQRAVAGALDGLPDSNPLFVDLINQTSGGARQAFNALSGEVHATVSGVLVQDSRFVRDAILGRLVQASYAGGSNQNIALAAGGPTSVAFGNTTGRMALGLGSGDDGGSWDANVIPSSVRGLTFWSRGFGSWGEIDGNGNAAGAKRTLGGFVSGVDAGIGNGWRAGVATGYMNSDIAVDARSSSADVDSYILAGYAGGAYGPFALRSGAAWTWHNIDSSRAVVFPGFGENERANYDGDTGQIFGEIAYPIVTLGSAVEPFAGLGYVHESTDRFTESGGDASLSGAHSDQDVGYSTLGIRAATTAVVAGYTVTPHTSVAWQYAFGDITPEQTLAFSSANVAFGVSGAPIARNSALVEAGVDLNFAPDATLSFSYVGQLADDVTDNGVQGRFNWRF